mgnify:CR=1 FL=1
MFETLKTYLPFIIPLLLIQLALMGAAIYSILHQRHFRTGNKALWIAVSILVNIIGPVLYFTLGRDDHAGDY